MFEDATFDSTCSIRTHSRNWMFAAFSFNGSILLALVLIPLLNPQALPPMALPFLVELPPPPAQVVPQPQHAQTTAALTQVVDGRQGIHVRIPRSIFPPPEE